MAVAQAQPMSSPFGSGFQSFVELLAQGADEISGNRLGDFLQQSSGNSALPSFLSGSSFGVTKALQSTRPAPTVKEMLVETMEYTIEEARDRLSDLVNGGFIPESINDLYEYLRERSFSIETRINKITGDAANYLIDMTTQRSVPAAQVDPMLSRENMLKLWLQSQLKEQIGRDTPAKAFDSWSGMSWTRDSIESKFGYTVEKNQGYFGRVIGVVSDDPAETKQIISECKRRNIDIIVPRDNNGTGQPVAGLPILARNKSMKAELVDRGLKYSVLAEKFGDGMIDHYVKMADNSNATNPDKLTATELSLERFNSMFLNQDSPVQAPQEDGFGFGISIEEADTVIKVANDGQLIAWDRSSDTEIPTAVEGLPYGEYERLDARGVLSGYITVDDDAHVSHYDINHREIPKSLPMVGRDESYSLSSSYGF